MTTALLETATGSGLSLGSSAALSVAARRRKSSNSFFIEEILAAGGVWLSYRRGQALADSRRDAGATGAYLAGAGARWSAANSEVARKVSARGRLWMPGRDADTRSSRRLSARDGSKSPRVW